MRMRCSCLGRLPISPPHGIASSLIFLLFPPSAFPFLLLSPLPPPFPCQISTRNITRQRERTSGSFQAHHSYVVRLALARAQYLPGRSHHLGAVSTSNVPNRARARRMHAPDRKSTLSPPTMIGPPRPAGHSALTILVTSVTFEDSRKWEGK